MEWTRTRTWLIAAMVAPAFVGTLVAGCGDDGDDPAVVADAAAGADAAGGGAGGAGGTGGTTPDAAGTVADTASTPTATSVTADIGADTNWGAGTYILRKKIYVISPAKLTIAAGATILGDPAAGDKPALIITRGAQLIAKGTKEKPIVFTSGNPAGAKRGGDWGGVVLLGNAKINSGDPCASGVAGCKETGIEGIPRTELKATFGGTDDTSNCGTLEYVRIEFAGAELEPNRELNGLMLGGCGTGTKVSYIQSHRGTDDGIEVFGGTVNMDHIVLSGNEDDSLDWDYGWTGKVQFLVVHQRGAVGDHGFEGAGSPLGETLLPRTAPTIYNATLVGRTDGGKAMHLKEGTRGIMRNLIVQGWKADVIKFTAKEVDLTMEWPMFLTIENSAFFGNAMYTDETKLDAMGKSLDDDKGFSDQGAVEAPARNNKLDVDPMLTSINDLADGTAPNYVPKNAAVGTGAATPPAGFDITATYLGAFKPNDTAPWTDGWTAYPKN